MSSRTVSPKMLTERLSGELPAEVKQGMVLIGSLAAAYHYRNEIGASAIRTKDADLLLSPRSAAVLSGQRGAEVLLDAGWTPQLEYGLPGKSPKPANALPVIRLFPPESHDYFVEFLSVPGTDPSLEKEWIPVRVQDGWFALPAFRFIGLTAWSPLTSESGIKYARPSTMALANLLSHQAIGKARMSTSYYTPDGDKYLKRANKDLGRVLALAYLEGEDSLDWLADWRSALDSVFPNTHPQLSPKVGLGLRELLDSPADLEEAWLTCDYGLLKDLGVDPQALRIAGER
ncbi:MAG: hypothetical protein ACI9BV_003746, partial [Rhodothermales bacterium]